MTPPTIRPLLVAELLVEGTPDLSCVRSVDLATHGSWIAETCCASEESGLCAVGDLEFGEDGRDVVADGFLAQEDFGGYRRVALVLCEELEDLEFPVGELREREAGVSGGWRGEEVLEPVGDPWAEYGFAVGDGADRAERFVLCGSF
jgi:hypothetical protein